GSSLHTGGLSCRKTKTREAYLVHDQSRINKRTSHSMHRSSPQTSLMPSTRCSLLIRLLLIGTWTLAQPLIWRQIKDLQNSDGSSAQ
ncbi:unnamed protein product, partial [Brassica oleracea var. botrytis]